MTLPFFDDDDKPPDSFLLSKLELTVPYKCDGLIFASLDKIVLEDLDVFDRDCIPLLRNYSSKLKQPLGPGIQPKLYHEIDQDLNHSFAPVNFHNRSQSQSQSQSQHTRQLDSPEVSPRPHKRSKKLFESPSPPPLLPFPTTLTPCAYFNSYQNNGNDNDHLQSRHYLFSSPQKLTIDLNPGGRATRYLAIRFLNSNCSRFDASRVKVFG